MQQRTLLPTPKWWRLLDQNAPVSAAVDPAVSKALASSGKDLKHKKTAKTSAQLAEEEKMRLDASLKARMADRAFWMVFAPELTSVVPDKYNKSKGVLLDPITKGVVAKSSVCIEMCEFMAVAVASRCSGEGNAGFPGKNYVTSRGAAKYSIMLTPGWSQIGVACPADVVRRSTICMNKMVECQERMLGLWFDGTADSECPTHYKTCLNSVRSKKGGSMTPQKDAEEVQVMESTNAQLKEEMRVAARAKWIATCGVQFRETKDEAGRAQQRVCFVSKKVYSVKPKVYTGKQMPPGPSLDDVPSKNELMPQVHKMMDAFGWKRNYLKYQLEAVDPTLPERHLNPNVVFVPDLDNFGNPILNNEGKPKMVEVIDLAWDPLNISPEGHPITSMIKVYVTFNLSNGGTSGKPNVSASISGDIIIVRQDRRRVQEYYATAKDLTTGVYKAPVIKRDGVDDEGADAETAPDRPLGEFTEEEIQKLREQQEDDNPVEDQAL
jgi:hypothetical protein